MKTTTKATLILSGVLLLGIVIGFFVSSSYLRFSHHKRVDEFRRGEGFIAEMEQMIEPLPEQKDQVRAILRRHSEWMKQFSEEQLQIFKKSIDSLNSEISKVLTPEQAARFNQRIKEMGRHPPMRIPGPPPPPPFPGDEPHQ